MNRIATALLLLTTAAAALAQSPGIHAQPSEERKARLREMVSQESGEITALEPSTLGDGSVLVGYSSGKVLRCRSAESCDELTGTPNIAVLDVVASKQSESEVIWVSYGQGALYRCVETRCTKQARDE